MKKILLLVVLTAFLGTFVYAVILKRNKTIQKTENTKKKECGEKKSRCAYFQ
jgi:uncharacterized membrane protein